MFALLISHLPAQTWHWINPANGHYHINDLDFISSGNGFAVADNGVILQCVNGSWSQPESPVTENLLAVKCISSVSAWAVGENGTILNWDGNTWQQENSPATATLRDICFVDASHGWAVGNSILFFDGSNWTVQADISGLSAVAFVSATDGYAGGLNSVFFSYSNGTWSEDDSFADLGYFDIKSIETTSQGTYVLNCSDLDGNGSVFENAGSGWQSMGAGAVNAGASFADNLNGFGIGNRGNFVYNTYPTINHYSDGDWTCSYTTKMKNTLTSVNAVNQNEVYASDSMGFIYHGQSGNFTIANGAATTDSIFDISFIAANNFYMACNAGGIWHYQAGYWTNELNVPGFRFNTVEFSSENSGWAVAYRLLDMFPGPYNYETKVFSCTNGNWEEVILTDYLELWEPASSIDISTWNTLAIPSYNILYVQNGGVWDTTVFPMTDSITCMQFMDPVPVFASEMKTMPAEEEAWLSIKRTEGEIKGAIYYNDPVSDAWSISYETTAGAFNDLCVADYMNIYAVGDNGLIAHFDGSEWQEAEAVTSEDLLSVCINSDNEGWASGRNGTLIHFNGLSWPLVPSGTSNDLFCTDFYKNEVGLAGGQNGSLLCSLPQLPVEVRKPVNDPENAQLMIFPNPAKGIACIQFINPDGSDVALQLTDITGRETPVRQFNTGYTGLQTLWLNTSGLPGGVYLVTITSGSVTLSGKVLVSR